MTIQSRGTLHGTPEGTCVGAREGTSEATKPAKRTRKEQGNDWNRRDRLNIIPVRCRSPGLLRSSHPGPFFRGQGLARGRSFRRLLRAPGCCFACRGLALRCMRLSLARRACGCGLRMSRRSGRRSCSSACTPRRCARGVHRSGVFYARRRFCGRFLGARGFRRCRSGCAVAVAGLRDCLRCFRGRLFCRRRALAAAESARASLRRRRNERAAFFQSQ